MTERRWLAAGDPQTSRERFFAVLDRYEMRGTDGKLRPDVGLLSMGDHFDYGADATESEREGRAILEWLALHPEDQVLVLAGNHDLSRVMELAYETNDSYREAQALARTKDERAFASRFPHIPTPGIATRDYFSFSEAQRALVEDLLLKRRMRLALTAKVGGTNALFTHAGVTDREIGLLGLAPDADANAIAAALNALLDRALDRVRAAWTNGERAALDLSPVHVAGTTGREGGGLFYHRPARRDREGADSAWENDPERPRRFDPRSLPRGLVQVIAHSPHPRCVRDLPGWVEPSANVEALALRTLHGGSEPSYHAGVHPTPGSVIMIDPGFAKAPLETIELLPIER